MGVNYVNRNNKNLRCNLRQVRYRNRLDFTECNAVLRTGRGIAILSIILAIGMYKIYGNKDYVGFSAIICIIASIVICHQFFDILAALTFPEKTILDFITTYTPN